MNRSIVVNSLNQLGLFDTGVCAARLLNRRRRSVVIQQTQLADFQNCAGELIWKRLSAGAELHLQRELDNPVDSDAVAVYWRDHKLGILPYGESFVVARLLDRNATLSARIKALRVCDQPRERIRISVSLEV